MNESVCALRKTGIVERDPPLPFPNANLEAWMTARRTYSLNLRTIWTGLAALMLFCALAWAFVSCSSAPSMSSAQMGAATVTLSDPPSCAAPRGNFKSVFVTIRSVQAHISASADDNSSGWQELAPQLNSHPVQLDLLNLPLNGACLLEQLGSTSSLPVGDYQQIRLLLVPNGPPSGPVPATNACAGLGQVFNCVVDSTNNFSELLLSSQANTGLKIPPGQIVGGPIHVAAGRSVDINVDFNACASIVSEGNGSFRLKPALTAGQISPNTTGISGQIVDSNTKLPIAGAQVALEQDDNTGTEHIFMQAASDANGNFRFCPLPTAAVFDVVADAVSGTGVAYNATVLLHVPMGTALGSLPLVAETGTPNGPAVIQGLVTAVNGTAGADTDISFAALQGISLSGGGTLQIAVPLLNTSLQSSTPSVAVQSSTPCQGATPTGAFCAPYALVVPASNPSVGTFVSGTAATFALPAAGPVPYSVLAQASQPMSGGAAFCSPSTETTNLDSSGNPLQATAGTTVTAKELDFSGCM